MVGNADPVADHGAPERDVVDVLDGVRVRVDVRVVGDRRVVADDHLSAVVDQDVPMDRHSVADRQVVPERKLHLVKNTDVPPAATENPLREHRPDLRTEPDVPAHGGVVEHLPEPEKRFHAGPLREVDLPVVLRLESRVARIERGEERADGERRRRLPGRLLPGDVAAQIQAGQRFAGDDIPVERGIIELLRQLLHEAGIHFLPRQTDRKPAQGHVAATLAERFRPVKLATALILVALLETPLCALPSAARSAGAARTEARAESNLVSRRIDRAKKRSTTAPFARRSKSSCRVGRDSLFPRGRIGSAGSGADAKKVPLALFFLSPASGRGVRCRPGARVRAPRRAATSLSRPAATNLSLSRTLSEMPPQEIDGQRDAEAGRPGCIPGVLLFEVRDAGDVYVRPGNVLRDDLLQENGGGDRSCIAAGGVLHVRPLGPEVLAIVVPEREAPETLPTRFPRS